MNIPKQRSVDSFISRAVSHGQGILDRSSPMPGPVSKFIGSEGMRVSDNARNTLADGLSSAARYISARRSFLRSPLFITLSLGAAAAAVAYYNRERIKAAAIRAKDAVKPRAHRAAKTIQDKASNVATSAADTVEKTKSQALSTTTH